MEVLHPRPKDEFCWIAYDQGSYASGRSAFEAERANGGSVDDAKAAERGMILFIQEVC
jgi:hypothetical protein